MKKSALITIIASATIANAQVTLENGTYTCSKPNVAFCSADSLKTDIIIRCDSTGQGQPGRCSDNLAGQPPLGVRLALCYQSDPTIGDAACEKNCVVYGGSGNSNGTFTLPADVCTPTVSETSTVTGTATSCGGCSESETATTKVVTTTTSVCPSSTEGEMTPSMTLPPTTFSPPVTTAPTSAMFPSNGTGNTGAPTTKVTLTTSPSATPVGPTSTGPSIIPTAGAAANVAAGGLLAALGMVVVYAL